MPVGKSCWKEQKKLQAEVGAAPDIAEGRG